MTKYDIEKCVKIHGTPLWETDFEIENAEVSFEKMMELCLSLNTKDFLRVWEVNKDNNVELRIDRKEWGWWYVNIWVREEYKGDYLVGCCGLKNFLGDIFLKRNSQTSKI